MTHQFPATMAYNDAIRKAFRETIIIMAKSDDHIISNEATRIMCDVLYGSEMIGLYCDAHAECILKGVDSDCYHQLLKQVYGTAKIPG
jgi:hypothetical protein